LDSLLLGLWLAVLELGVLGAVALLRTRREGQGTPEIMSELVVLSTRVTTFRILGIKEQ